MIPFPLAAPQGALGNLVRNSGMLCGDIMQAGALQVGCKMVVVACAVVRLAGLGAAGRLLWGQLLSMPLHVGGLLQADSAAACTRDLHPMPQAAYEL